MRKRSFFIVFVLPLSDGSTAPSRFCRRHWRLCAQCSRVRRFGRSMWPRVYRSAASAPPNAKVTQNGKNRREKKKKIRSVCFSLTFAVLRAEGGLVFSTVSEFVRAVKPEAADEQSERSAQQQQQPVAVKSEPEPLTGPRPVVMNEVRFALRVFAFLRFVCAFSHMLCWQDGEIIEEEQLAPPDGREEGELVVADMPFQVWQATAHFFRNLVSDFVSLLCVTGGGTGCGVGYGRHSGVSAHTRRRLATR